ncbi:MAG: DUF3459 domain-containing protein, partial [Hyphomonadaceae bacterium]|nr:DUF3459 domain-containing protein [Hyphomonadaceae bacterium]
VSLKKKNATRFWLARGVDGFRLDVVNFFAHDAQLRDNPAIPAKKSPARPHQFQRHLFDRTQPETLDFVARLRELLNEYGAVAVGEIEDEDPLPVQRTYTDGPTRLHSAYSFFLLRAAKATPELFQRALHGWDSAAGWPSWSLSNHDVVRVATRFADDKPERVKLMLAVLLSMRGTAFLYQGDELGLPHANISFERLRDPEAIAFWPNGIGRDGARTPMPWTVTKPMVGFTIGDDAWLPVDPRHRAMAVDVQEDDPDSVLHFTRAFLAMRRESAALRVGALKYLDAPPGVLAFEREAEGERVICLFNLGTKVVSCAVPPGTPLSEVGSAEILGDKAALDAYSAILLKI